MPAWDNWWESAVLHCPVQTWQEQGTQALISTLLRAQEAGTAAQELAQELEEREC